MVEFKKDGYSIHVNTTYNPVEDWLNLMSELISVISLMDEQSLIKPCMTLNLLEDMLPDYEAAKKMIE
jgi:hypothetical protein